MKNQFSKESLEKLGIFELRNLAREIGVYSPTIYKKEEIIQKIVAIVSGEAEPYQKKTKQGRPPKAIHSINNILDIFIPKSIEEKPYDTNLEDVQWLSNITAMESNHIYINYNAEDSNKKVNAILQVFEEGYGFCYEKGYKTHALDQNFFVSNSIILNYNLKSGDVLEGLIKKIADDKPYVLYKVEKINGIEVAKFNFNRENFNNFKAQYPTEKIMLKENEKSINHLYFNHYLPLGKGQRAILLANKNVDYANLITYYFNAVEENQNIYKECILIDERPEDITEYVSELKDSKIVYTTVEDEPHQAIQKVELCIEQAKRKVEENKDVLLFISNLNRLHNLCKKQASIKGTPSGQDEMNSITMVKKMLSSARKTEHNGTLTIIGIVEKDSDETFILQLKELCNMCIVLNEKSYLKEDKIWFDILNSETRKMQLLLSKEEFEEVVKLKENLTSENVEEKTLMLEKKLLNQIK